MKIKINWIRREADTFLNTNQSDPAKFIESRLQAVEQIKVHATLALNEGDVNSAVKMFKKGAGILSTIPKSYYEKDELEEIDEDDFKAKIFKLLTSLKLNQGLCHWKNCEWEEMRQANRDIINNYDPNWVKARYRLAVAAKELEAYDEGVESLKNTIHDQTNKECRKLYELFKILDKNNRWRSFNKYKIIKLNKTHIKRDFDIIFLFQRCTSWQRTKMSCILSQDWEIRWIYLKFNIKSIKVIILVSTKIQ